MIYSSLLPIVVPWWILMQGSPCATEVKDAMKALATCDQRPFIGAF